VAQHITRKELKTDQLREGFVHGAEAVASHQSQVWMYGGLVLAVVLVVLSWRFYTQRQTSAASDAFGDAMKIYQARIVMPGEPTAPDEVTYQDEKNRDGDALKKFDAVASKYPRTRPGQMARYYSALCLETLSRFDEAQKDLKLVESSSDQGLVSLARFQDAAILDRTGKSAEAVQIYQQLADNPSLFVPKPVVLLALADHYSTSDPDQAAKFYRQVKTEFPDTPAATTADQRLQLLPAKS
jgi:tetratricopeptide (TPR) repeat protein